MPKLGEMLNIRRRSLRKQADTLTAFVTETKAPFATADEMVTTFRRANKDTIRALGVRG